MGITGLLPLLKPIHNYAHLRDFTGKRFAVDGYVWLHRAAYSCAADLVNERKTNKSVLKVSLMPISLLKCLV
jgi:exonuclease 1